MVIRAKAVAANLDITFGSVEIQSVMKTKKHTDRKDGLESILREANKIEHSPHECVQAWLRLCRELEFMIEPEATMPRFNRLAHALWIAATNDHS